MNITDIIEVGGMQGEMNLDALRVTDTKQVIHDARWILERFLSITDELVSSRHVLHPSSFAVGILDHKDIENVHRGSQSDVEHQYALVDDIIHDQLPTPYQAMESDDEGDDDKDLKESKAIVDNFKRLLSTESTYVDCQMLGSFVRTETDFSSHNSSERPSCFLLKNKAVKDSPLLSQVSEKNVRTASPRYPRTHSPPGNVKYAIKHSTNVSRTPRIVAEGKNPKMGKISKTKTASRAKALTEDRSSSSCSEDYEVSNAELLKSNKKSRFRQAVEHFQRSFPWSGRKKSVVNSIQNKNSPRVRSKSDVPLPAPPGVNNTEEWLLTLTAKSRCKDFLYRGNENSFSVNTSCESIIDNRSTATATGRVGGDGSEQSCMYPVPWSKRSMRDVRKGEDESERDLSKNEGIFDGILRHIKSRRGKLRCKGDQILKRRCRSADNVFIRPLSKNNIRLIEQFRTPASMSSRKDLYSTAKSHIVSASYKHNEYFKGKNMSTDEKNIDDLLTPWLVNKGRSDGGKGEGHLHGGHYSERERMTLAGLTTSRPRGEAVEERTASCASSEHGESVSLDFDAALNLDAISSAIDTPVHAANWYAVLEEHSSSKSFQEKSEWEKDELLESVAEQLAIIASQYNTCVDAVSSSTEDMLDVAKATTAVNDTIYSSVTSITETVEVIDPVRAELINVTSYQKFQQILSETIGEVGKQINWKLIARTFRFIWSAIQLAGVGSPISRRIKEMTLKYFEDQYADWVVKQGGWKPKTASNNLLGISVGSEICLQLSRSGC